MEKKLYKTPELAVIGNVEKLTQATFRLGSGDILTQIVSLGHLDSDCHSRLFGDTFCVQTGS